MKTFLTLIRWQNLLFVGVTLWLIQRAVIDPILFTHGLPTFCSNTQLLLLIGGIVSIVAGGYAINDYFDVKIDAINKPDKYLIGRIVDRRYAMIIHQCCTIFGVSLGLALAYWIRSWPVTMIFLFIPGLLWFYSSSYKRQFVIGNIIVAFNAALSILLMAIANAKLLHNSLGDEMYQSTMLPTLYKWVAFFAGFTLVMTLIREIIKDIEDEKGDRELECHTLPIIWGVKRTKATISLLILLTIGALCYLYLTQMPILIKQTTLLPLKFLLVGIVAPMLLLIFCVIKAKSKPDFRMASLLCKSILGVGILYSLVFYHIQALLYHFPFFGY